MRAFLDHLNGMQADQIIAWTFICSLPLIGAFALKQIITSACELYARLEDQRAKREFGMSGSAFLGNAAAKDKENKK